MLHDYQNIPEVEMLIFGFQNFQKEFDKISLCKWTGSYIPLTM